MDSTGSGQGLMQGLPNAVAQLRVPKRSKEFLDHTNNYQSFKNPNKISKGFTASVIFLIRNRKGDLMQAM
jgi:hypothetical protein